MTFSGKSLTKADEARRRSIHAGNCMACAQRGIDMTDSGLIQWHHTEGKKRHDLTCGLCQWHHMGRLPEGWSEEACREYFGPSLFHEKKLFHEEFGSNEQLLEQQNKALGMA